jgi:hypothetical protein
MIMNPKLANELRKHYRSAAMRVGVGGLPGHVYVIAGLPTRTGSIPDSSLYTRMTEGRR